MRRAVINVATTLKALSLYVKSMLDPRVFFVPKPFGLFVEMVDGSYPMPILGDDVDADVRLLREVAAARRALSMALLAISTAADDCHTEE